MKNRCYVICRWQDRARFEACGFRIETDTNRPVVRMVHANFAPHKKLPADIPFIARSDAGDDRASIRVACDGKKTVGISMDHNGGFTVAWNYQRHRPEWESLWQIRRYLKLERRVEKQFKKLIAPSLEHRFNPDTNICVCCGQPAGEDADIVCIH